MKGLCWVLWFSAFCLSCSARPPSRAIAEPLALQGSDGRQHDVSRTIAANRLTVFVFYSETCPCLRVHEARLESIRTDYAPRGVAVILVNSELGADASRDALEARRRGYRFPLLTDPHARLAGALNAQFATHSVVVDASGRIRYSGGIDSDKNHLLSATKPYLRNALDDLLAGRAPREPEPEPLGCALQLR